MSGQAGHHKHHGAKSSDGGYHAALASFLIVMFFFLARSGVLFVPSRGEKMFILSLAFVSALYAFYRKLKYHDMSMRSMWTDFFLWIALAFCLPGLVYYLFLS